MVVVRDSSISKGTNIFTHIYRIMRKIFYFILDWSAVNIQKYYIFCSNKQFIGTISCGKWYLNETSPGTASDSESSSAPLEPTLQRTALREPRGIRLDAELSWSKWLKKKYCLQTTKNCKTNILNLQICIKKILLWTNNTKSQDLFDLHSPYFSPLWTWSYCLTLSWLVSANLLWCFLFETQL